MSALKASNICHSYGSGDRVLAGVDVSVDGGEILAVMGQSGSGKSTLLHILAGLITPTSGHVLMNGEPFSEMAEARRDGTRLRNIGFVFQHGDLLPDMTLLENVGLPLRLQGLSRRDAELSARHRLDEVGLDAEVDRVPSEVSGGQQQRAAIARALVHDPSVLLADEPTGSLDKQNARAALDLLLELAVGGGAGVVIVTHSSEVARRCDRIVELVGGRCLAPSEARVS